MADMARKLDQAPDWANLVFAGLLFVAPFFLAFNFDMAAAWNAWLMGYIIAGLAIAAILRYAEWEEWVNALLGLWLIVSPWILGFAHDSAAFWTHVIVGALVALSAAWRGAMARVAQEHAHA